MTSRSPWQRPFLVYESFIDLWGWSVRMLYSHSHSCIIWKLFMALIPIPERAWILRLPPPRMACKFCFVTILSINMRYSMPMFIEGSFNSYFGERDCIKVPLCSVISHLIISFQTIVGGNHCSRWVRVYGFRIGDIWRVRFVVRDHFSASELLG